MKCSYNDPPVKIASSDFSVNLIEFDHFICYDIILGWDFLKRYEAKIECALEKIKLKGRHGRQVTYRRLPHQSNVKLISCIRMQNYVRKKHNVFIFHVKDLSVKSADLDSVLVVREFPDLFP